MPSEDLALLPAGPDDLAEVAALYVAVREAAPPAMPPPVRDADAIRRRFLARDLGRPGHELWLARDADRRLLGFAELTGDWLDDLHVAAEAQRGGVGSALLALVKSRRPGGFCLWVFETNVPARAFYAGRGLVELETTDGSGNEERAPDVRMAWPGSDPLAFLRGLVDDVDDGLGDLLARRLALTRQIQGHKHAAGGALPARDPGRERAVARRLAVRAPELGEERLARLVEVLIAESLDAVAGERPDAP